MEFHRPQDAWWLRSGCAAVCATATSIISPAQLGHAGHQLDIFVSGTVLSCQGRKINSHPSFVPVLAVLPPSLLESLSPQLLWHRDGKPCLLPEKNLVLCVCWRDGTTLICGQIYAPKMRQWQKAYPNHQWGPFACPDIQTKHGLSAVTVRDIFNPAF